VSALGGVLDPAGLHGRWTRAERVRLSGVLAVIATLHLVGWTLYLTYSGRPGIAGGYAGAGALAYSLGVRHAFDADHVAAIDDTTRLMMQRGRRPVGVGFFFALGHSAVVLLLAVVVALSASSVAESHAQAFGQVGAVVAVGVATTFLLLVAVLNAGVLTTLLRLWRRLGRGVLDPVAVDAALARRGVMNRMLGGRLRGLVRSSWHMAPVGFLFGLGMETASEVTLLAIAASSASSGSVPVAAVLALPLLFASGMTAFDTADSLLMSRAYSWGFRSPARRIFYNLTTTGLTVGVALFVASVYLAALLADYAGVGGPVAVYGALADRFELLGYGIVALFALVWGGAALVWRYGGLAARHEGRSL
jgi:nickel/cobalt transporter (NiCoT) family protein